MTHPRDGSNPFPGLAENGATLTSPSLPPASSAGQVIRDLFLHTTYYFLFHQPLLYFCLFHLSNTMLEAKGRGWALENDGCVLGRKATAHSDVPDLFVLTFSFGVARFFVTRG